LQAENRYKRGSRRSAKIFEDGYDEVDHLQEELLIARDRIRKLESEVEGSFENKSNLR
jgi:exonuclease VII small subunit